ncbi:uncharacterized protein LOC126633451 [Malus sylvestris]|uniref:uncharacterized protein LOC126633451 n=1 Tax=Malus sylvestris TaxID=3752 RepID=UPI0021ACC596|nr:uncharacterized protein LOC126633451 [Malus sylvestris]
MELSIAHHRKNEPIIDYKNDKVLETKVEKAAWKSTKEAMTVNTAPVKVSTRGKVIQTEAFCDQEMRKRTLKELEEKTYPFPDSDVAAMLEDLLENKVIGLPECRRPEEMNRTDSPRYCKFHRFISHSTEKCFVLKDLILKLAQQGNIELDLEDTVVAHTTTIVFGSLDHVPLQSMHDHSRQCSSHTALPTQPSPGASNQDASTGNKEGWTSATYKKMRKPRPQATRPKEEPKPAPRTSVFDRLNHSKPRNSALDRINGRDKLPSSKGLRRQHRKDLSLKGYQNPINKAAQLDLPRNSRLRTDLKKLRNLLETGRQRQRKKSSTV